MHTLPPPPETKPLLMRRAPSNRSFWARMRARLSDHATFMGALLRSPLTVGAFCPSSRALARAMVAGFDLHRAGLVVELGPGTGSFTEVIAEHMGPGTDFFALELDPGAVGHLRQRFPHLTVHNDPAERLGEHLRRSRRPHVDYVVSGLPWAIFPADVQTRTMRVVAAALRPGGGFTTFTYLHARRSPAGRRYWKMLPELFSRVEMSKPVWGNLPPAVVYRCVK